MTKKHLSLKDLKKSIEDIYDNHRLMDEMEEVAEFVHEFQDLNKKYQIFNLLELSKKFLEKGLAFTMTIDADGENEMVLYGDKEDSITIQEKDYHYTMKSAYCQGFYDKKSEFYINYEKYKMIFKAMNIEIEELSDYR